MIHQYFQVGEEVILQCRNAPSFNGEYVVSKVRAELFNHPRLGVIEGVAYLLDGLVVGGGDSDSWCMQNTLRKKHHPGDSMADLMESLTSKTPRPVISRPTTTNCRCVMNPTIKDNK